MTTNIRLLPLPESVIKKDGFFTVDHRTAIGYGDGQVEAGKVALFLQVELARRHGLRLELSGRGNIALEIIPDLPGAGSEGYELHVLPEGVSLKASTPAGLFYAVQTFLQLLPVEENLNPPALIPAIMIHDRPRFRWRGMHLDVARHFFPKEDVKKYINLLALHRLNVFHWHLVDDQGWRIEIKQYPRLTEMGAWRKDASSGLYGGYYSQDDVREIVAYAAERFVTVVPEIEMPGHARAALAAYPEYSCTGGPFEVETQWGIFEDVFCPGREETFAFLQNVLDEVMGLFPGKYLHIGGDECSKSRWKQCPRCQARISHEGLADEHELQSYFVNRMGRYLLEKGKKYVGWDEILEGKPAANAIVMSWQGMEPGLRAARAGHQVIMSPTSHCYFDYYQAESTREPKAIGGFLPLEKVYEFDPLPTGLESEYANRILGGQGNVWTEYMPDLPQVEYMALPRLCALAEVLWSAREDRHQESFMKRLDDHLAWLGLLGHNYRDPYQ